MTRSLPYLLAILLSLLLIHALTATDELFQCVNDKLHSQYPEPNRALVWGGCSWLTLAFPLSFFQ